MTEAQLDNTLVALADPTRRAILQRLRRGEARVTELAAPFAISLNSVSKHIKLLERAELVERTKRGREHLIRFRPEPLDAAQRWIEQQQASGGVDSSGSTPS
ncbi:MAG: winged helix-turn-helix transcriptional regulator [Labilithrix sp.]|nr:winged helix-turn-helix transcriptional regulator [Labilithrix sp.]